MFSHLDATLELLLQNRTGRRKGIPKGTDETPHRIYEETTYEDKKKLEEI